ncbi:MAG TPA: ABC transporter permease [Actinophytocola sp.]|uniref:ABC transporter permease n=1 Tax=Actinophytocola sp. TaxID=1872138 RepID=UPI002DB8AEF1|nr:ABC transporter permease [Actinophytocola sp.]HEU5472213.1 ABC transporter permease [Actinophytocola sp.]
MNPLARLTLTESKLFFREPIGVFFTLVVPPLLLVILGSVPAFREPQEGLGGQRVIDLYAPIIIATVIVMFALNGLPQMLASYREKGILRRMATTPVRPLTMLTAQLAMCTVLSIVASVGVLAIARIAFAVPLPDQIVGYALMFVLCTVASLSIGLLIAAVAPSGKAAGAIGSILFFPVMFFAGLWIPRAVMPDVLVRISDLTPLGAGVQSLQDTASGSWPQLLHVAVMLVWTVVAGAVAVRYFRWEAAR